MPWCGPWRPCPTGLWSAEIPTAVFRLGYEYNPGIHRTARVSINRLVALDGVCLYCCRGIRFYWFGSVARKTVWFWQGLSVGSQESQVAAANDQVS